MRYHTAFRSPSCAPNRRDSRPNYVHQLTDPELGPPTVLITMSSNSGDFDPQVTQRARGRRGEAHRLPQGRLDAAPGRADPAHLAPAELLDPALRSRIERIRRCAAASTACRRPVIAGPLVFVMAFGLFSFTTQPLTGYEPETAAVTEGLVLEGHFWDEEDSPLPLTADIAGKGGHHYCEDRPPAAPARGAVLRRRTPRRRHLRLLHEFPIAYVFLWFFNPFIAALAAVALFALVFHDPRLAQWAATIAALFTVASIAWPYSKIGMETTFMFAILAAFALAVWARRSPSVLSWGLTGFATGAAVATKAYALVAIAADRDPPLADLRALDRRQRVRLGSPPACRCCSGSARSPGTTGGGSAR